MPKETKKLIVVIAMPGIFMLDIAGPCDVFIAADMALNNNAYEVLLASPLDTLQVTTKGAISVNCHVKISEINRPIDTLIVAGFSRQQLTKGHPLFQWLRDTYPKLRRIGSICVGTY